MTTVYVLQHVRELPDGSEEVKLIGVFRTRQSAEDAARASSGLPGFSDHRDGFSIDPYELDRAYWAEGFVTRR